MKDGFDNKMKIIGITGSNGKTTTGHMIRAIFEEANMKISQMGELDHIVSSGISENTFRFLYKSMEKGVDWAIVEVPFQGLKDESVKDIVLDTAIITNISIEQSIYNGPNNCLGDKKILFQGLGNNSKAIINGDDPWALKMVEGKENIYVITYGLKTKATATASSIDISQGIAFNYCLQRSLDSYRQKKIYMQEFPIEINLLGYQNIYNSLAAITTALIYEIPVNKIQKALKTLQPIPRRLEYYSLSSYHILDDYAYNPSSFDAAFQALQTIDYNRAYLLIAIRGNGGVDINKKNAETICNWCSLLGIENIFITQCNESSQGKYQVRPMERKAFLGIFDKRGFSYVFTPNLLEGIKKIMSMAESRDIIAFLGGPGMNGARATMEKIIEDSQRKIFR